MTFTTASPRYYLVVPAAGSGRRLPGACPKQYREVAGKAVLQHTLERAGKLMVQITAGEFSQVFLGEPFVSIDRKPQALCLRFFILPPFPTDRSLMHLLF